MNRLRRVIAASAVLILLLSSCAQKRSESGLRGRVVTDCVGGSVKLPSEVKRIGCLYAFSVHVTTMLGRGDDIEAVVFGAKRDRLLNEINPKIRSAAVPTDDGILNIEEILKLNLDLIFIKGDTARLKTETDKLDRFGLTYLVIEYRTIDEQMKAISIIGEAIDRGEEAAAYNEYYAEALRRTGDRVANLKEDERVRVYHSVNEAARTDAPETIGSQWTKIAGAVNVSINDPLRLHDNKHFASLEQIYLWDPDVILANQEGVDEYIRESEKWAGLRAVRENRIYQIPVGISRWGHPGGMETPLAVLWTAKTLYPGLFEDLDMDQEIDRFYGDFFSFEISPEMRSSILSGRGMRLPKGSIRSGGGKG